MFNFIYIKFKSFKFDNKDFELSFKNKFFVSLKYYCFYDVVEINIFFE